MIILVFLKKSSLSRILIVIDYYSEVIQFYFEYALNFRNLQKSFKKIKGDDFQNKTEKCLYKPAKEKPFK